MTDDERRLLAHIHAGLPPSFEGVRAWLADAGVRVTLDYGDLPDDPRTLIDSVPGLLDQVKHLLAARFCLTCLARHASDDNAQCERFDPLDVVAMVKGSEALHKALDLYRVTLDAAAKQALALEGAPNTSQKSDEAGLARESYDRGCHAALRNAMLQAITLLDAARSGSQPPPAPVVAPPSQEGGERQGVTVEPGVPVGSLAAGGLPAGTHWVMGEPEGNGRVYITRPGGTGAGYEGAAEPWGGEWWVDWGDGLGFLRVMGWTGSWKRRVIVGTATEALQGGERQGGDES